MDLSTRPSTAVTDDEAPSLSTVPTEILHRIIQLTLPKLGFTTFRERYEELLRLARVNKLWAALAQRELQRHLLAQTERHCDAPLGEQGWSDGLTRSPWISGHPTTRPMPSEDVKDLVELIQPKVISVICTWSFLRIGMSALAPIADSEFARRPFRR